MLNSTLLFCPELLSSLVNYGVLKVKVSLSAQTPECPGVWSAQPSVSPECPAPGVSGAPTPDSLPSPTFSLESLSWSAQPTVSAECPGVFWSAQPQVSPGVPAPEFFCSWSAQPGVPSPRVSLECPTPESPWSAPSVPASWSRVFLVPNPQTVPGVPSPRVSLECPTPEYLCRERGMFEVTLNPKP